jgi:hypothetical protein
MTEPREHISNRRLRTPRAAAIAGILFALLMGISLTMLRIAIPTETLDSSAWLEEQAGTVTLALSLLPFAGIAFLWFMGVLRDRMGLLEDQFFSTLFFGSGLLYLAMTFASASIAGGILALYEFDPDLVLESGVFVFSRAMIYKFNSVYAIRMSGMFMFVLGTIWIRTQVMPRWLAFVTFTLALVLLIGVGLYAWVALLFPAWVFLISVYILLLNYRFQKTESERDGMTLGD